MKLFLAGLTALALAVPAVGEQQEQKALKRTSGLIAAGTKWQTPYTIVDSGVAGPTVLLTAGIHGNEPAGAEAAEQVRHWPIRRGKLIVVPRCNAPGLAANDRYLPDEGEATRDPNRNFPKTGAANSARTELAKALWAFAKRSKPDWHVDMHEGYGFRAAGSKSVGSSVIHFRGSKAAPTVARMLKAVNATVSETDRKFVPLGPPADGSFARATAQRLGAQSMILETTTDEIVDSKRKPRTLAVRVRQHRIMFHVLLTELKMAACKPSRMLFARTARPDRPAKVTAGVSAGPLRVAIYNGGGTGNKGLASVRRVLARQRDFAVSAPVSPADIADGALAQFDVVVFPGGSGSKQAAAIGPAGHKAVRAFIKGGGGYVGICAGAYLATYRYTWGLKIIDAYTVDRKHWNRGNGMVKVELTDAGRTVLAGPKRHMDIRYAQGPLLGPAKVDDLPDYTVLAHYRTEIAKKGAPKGVMVNTPAVISAPFGKGRVLCFSPHFESTQSEKGADALVRRALKWVASPPPKNGACNALFAIMQADRDAQGTTRSRITWECITQWRARRDPRLSCFGSEDARRVRRCHCPRETAPPLGRDRPRRLPGRRVVRTPGGPCRRSLLPPDPQAGSGESRPRRRRSRFPWSSARRRTAFRTRTSRDTTRRCGQRPAHSKRPNPALSA